MKNGEGEVKLVPEEGKQADNLLHPTHHQCVGDSIWLIHCAARLRSTHQPVS